LNTHTQIVKEMKSRKFHYSIDCGVILCGNRNVKRKWLK
jgi:hypothetical protein